MSQSVPSGSKPTDKPSGGNPKGKSSEPKKDRKHKPTSDKPKPSKPSVPRETPKKLFRLVVRKLPSKDFNEEDIVKCFDRVCGIVELGLLRDSFNLEHFSAGKISRKRGQVFSSAFVSVNDEAHYWKFLANFPGKVPFLEGVDESGQPEISVAPNQKAFKAKDRTDRHVNTFETDPVFLAFQAKLTAPADKLPSVETQLDQRKAAEQSKEDLIKNNPLLKYMREKAEKKLMERKLLRKGSKSSGLVVTAVLKSGRGSKKDSSSAVSGGGGSGKGEKSEKSSRGGRKERAAKDKDKDKEGGEGEASTKKPSSRSSRGERGEKGGKARGTEGTNASSAGGSDLSGMAPSAGGELTGGRGSGNKGQGAPSAAGEAPAPKFTIAKRGAPLSATAQDSHATGAPSSSQAQVTGSYLQTVPHMAPYAAHSSHASGYGGYVSGVVDGMAQMSLSAGADASAGAANRSGGGGRRDRPRGDKGRGGDEGGAGAGVASGDVRVTDVTGAGGRGEGKSNNRGGDRSDRGGGRGSRGGRGSGGGRGEGPPALQVPSA